MKEILRRGFAELDIAYDDTVLERFEAYRSFLEEMNSVMNLTAISGSEAVAKLHFLDCAALLKCADFRGKRVIDVGSGAGFPGLPLRIVESDMRLTLLDSTQKRVDFLRSACDMLGLDDVTCIHSRAEEAPANYRGSFDVTVSRAVARLNVLCELCLPFLDVEGVFIAMKGPECEQEIAEALGAIKLLGAEYEKTVTYDIPETDITHTAVIIRKTKPTHPQYPRKWAQIKKKPL